MATNEVTPRQRAESKFIANAMLAVVARNPDKDPFYWTFAFVPDIDTVGKAMDTYMHSKGWERFFEQGLKWEARFPWKAKDLQALLAENTNVSVLGALEQLPIHRKIRRLVNPTFGERLSDYGRLIRTKLRPG